MAQRTWLITGVSSGFGRVMTEQLLARGDRVIATVRDDAARQQLQALGAQVLLVDVVDSGETDTEVPGSLVGVVLPVGTVDSAPIALGSNWRSAPVSTAAS